MKPGVVPLHQANANNQGNPVLAGFLVLVLLGIIGGAVWYFKYRATRGDECTPDGTQLGGVTYKYNKDLECVGDKQEGDDCYSNDDLTVTEVDNGKYTYTINKDKMECTATSCMTGYSFSNDKTQCLTLSDKFYEILGPENEVTDDNLPDITTFVDDNYRNDNPPDGFSIMIDNNNPLDDQSLKMRCMQDNTNPSSQFNIPNTEILGPKAGASDTGSSYGSELGKVSRNDCSKMCKNNTDCTGFFYSHTEVVRPEDCGELCEGWDGTAGSIHKNVSGTCYLKSGDVTGGKFWANHNDRCYKKN